MLEFKLLYGREGAEKAAPLRKEVFTSELEFMCDCDSSDGTAHHIIGYDGNTMIGTAYISPLGDGIYKVGGIAVKKSYRHGFVGDLMIKTLQNKIVSLGGIGAVACVPSYCKDFFLFEGYAPCGKPYDDHGIEFIMMELDLSKPHRSCTCGQKGCETE